VAADAARAGRCRVNQHGVVDHRDLHPPSRRAAMATSYGLPHESRAVRGGRRTAPNSSATRKISRYTPSEGLTPAIGAGWPACGGASSSLCGRRPDE
jgi:hypothetical protein